MTVTRKVDLPRTVFVPESSYPQASQAPTTAPDWLQPDWSGPSDIFGAVELAENPGRQGQALGDEVGTVFQDGMQIGQYELIRLLGKGGMGVVYLARDNRLGRRVAIKFLQFNHPELTRRFIVEARATARCTHENIVVIHEVGEHAGSPFMVLEYVEGHTLSSQRDSTPLPVTRTAEVIVSVVRALARAHDEGIAHRDLKPDNILISHSGTVKVLDFGIAKLLEDTSAASAAGPVSVRREGSSSSFVQDAQKTGLVGTMAYMSPEQWVFGGDVDHRTDIWAVGIILYEMLTGQNPLEAFGDELQDWIGRLDLPVPSLATVAPQLPAELVRVVDTCLRKERAERFANARDLLRALEPFLPGRFHSGQSPLESGPYAGLRAFQEEDAGRFFGRSTELREILSRLRECPLMAVVGPSGVGKSSFLRAGVLPALRSAGEPWTVETVRPGRQPMLTLASLCVPLLAQQALPTESGSVEQAVRSRLILEPGFFGTVLRDYCRRTRQRLFILVDQFEELYTLSNHVLERAAFTACLASAADDAAGPARIVLTLRADFLGRVAQDASFLNILRGGLFFLAAPTSDGLREALVQPAELAGYRFESNVVVNEMVQFLEASPNGLPLLQFAASQLWEHRDPLRRMLTEHSYRGLGGVAGALVSHADRIVARFSIGRQALCRSLFTHLVTPERTRAVRGVEELAELVGEREELETLIEELVDSRLLVVQTTAGGSGVEIVHESLIINWPTLRGWLDASHEDSRFLDQLLGAAHQWEQNHRAPGLLWSGEMVDELKRFERRYQGKLPTVASEFVRALQGQARRRVRIRRVLSVFSLLVVAGLFAAGSVALVLISRAKAEAEENAATARRAERQAQTQLMERLAAEKSRKEAEDKSGLLEGKVKESDEELAVKNQALVVALSQAEQQKVIAEKAKLFAEANERAAKDANLKTAKANEEVQSLYERERERANRLDEQLGRLVEELH